MATSAPQLDPNTLQNLAIQLQQNQGPVPSGIAAPVHMPDSPPDLSIGASPHPQVQAPRGTLQGDQAERARVIGSGAGEDQIQGKLEQSHFGQVHPVAAKILGGLGQGIAKLGDVGLSAIAPALAINLPGTEYHHLADIHGLNKQIGAEEGEQKNEAQTANLEQQPEVAEAKNELGQEKLAETARQHDQQLREHGFKADDKGNIVPLSYEEMSPQQQAVQDLKGSQEELADATAALKKVQADPNSPQARMAQQRIDNAQQTRAIALQRLGLSEATFAARYHGTDTSGNPLPGAMITDEGQPVGSSFSQNVRPTGTERNKADMAASASEQLSDIANIVKRHPTLFGPGYGQSSAFRQWLGSQDPDAQRFVTARTIAGDHLAGTFGGRSEAALQALDTAIGQFKDNPAAMAAGIQQLAKANTRFQKAGTVKSEGSNAAAAGQGPASFKVKLSDAMALPQNKGKSEAEVEADVKKHGGEVVR